MKNKYGIMFDLAVGIILTIVGLYTLIITQNPEVSSLATVNLFVGLRLIYHGLEASRRNNTVYLKHQEKQ